jgi:hypothetical protein
MARFRLLSPVAGAPPRGTYMKFPSGTTIADSVGNALPGDIVWPAVALNPTPLVMAPLDAAGQSLLPGPLWPNPAYATAPYGCGLDAGS